MKIHNCKNCGEKDPTNFHKNYYYECKTCNNKRTKELREKRKLNPETMFYERDKKREYRKNNLIADKLLNAKTRSKTKDMEFDLDKEFVDKLLKEQNYKCVYSGIEFITGDPLYNMSLDRIDSSKGYTKNNIQLVCFIINRMKTDLPEDTFIELVKKIYHNIK